MNILLISGGDIDEAFAADFCRERHFDKVIAVDGGLKAADRLGFGNMSGSGVLTDIVGDFDTVSPELLEKYTAMSDLDSGNDPCVRPVIHRFNPEKDYTDTDIALKLAVDYCTASEEADADALPPAAPNKSHDRELWILGATGSRLDHVLANISMLLIPFRKGIRAWIMDANNRISLLSGKRTIEKKNCFGKYLSLIPLTASISGVTLTGVKYPLSDHRVLLGESLCVSNEITGEEAVLEIREGIAIVLETRD